MIIVTGLQRTGTSLIMRMAETAGFPIVGDKYPQDWKETRIDQNPDGFYEDMRFVDHGVCNLNAPITPDKDELAFIKIFSSGIPRTEFGFIKKVILCIRDWRTHSESWRKVFIFNVKKTEGKDIDDLRYPYGTEYCFKYGSIIFDYLKRKWPVLILNFEDLLAKPKESCEKVKGFIGCGRWDLAAELIDEKKNHHRKNKKIKPSMEFKDGFFSFLDRFYAELKTSKLSNELINDLKYWHEESRKQINAINKELQVERQKEKDARLFTNAEEQIETEEREELDKVK